MLSFRFLALASLVLLPTHGAIAEPVPSTSLTPVRGVTAQKRAPVVATSPAQLAFRLNEEGVALILKGQRQKGFAKLQQALSYDPNNTTVLYNLGGLYLTSGKPKEAIEIITRAVALDPKDLAFANRLAEAHFANNDVDNACKHYQEIVKKDPAFDQALLRLGTIYGMQEEWAKAEEALRKALKLGKHRTDAITNLSSILVVQEKHQDAISVIESLPKAERSHELLTTMGHSVRWAQEAGPSAYALPGRA